MINHPNNNITEIYLANSSQHLKTRHLRSRKKHFLIIIRNLLFHSGEPGKESNGTLIRRERDRQKGREHPSSFFPPLLAPPLDPRLREFPSSLERPRAMAIPIPPHSLRG